MLSNKIEFMEWYIEMQDKDFENKVIEQYTNYYPSY